jgi:hypothetical protein
MYIILDDTVVTSTEAYTSPQVRKCSQGISYDLLYLNFAHLLVISAVNRPVFRPTLRGMRAGYCSYSLRAYMYLSRVRIYYVPSSQGRRRSTYS